MVCFLYIYTPNGPKHSTNHSSGHPYSIHSLPNIHLSPSSCSSQTAERYNGGRHEHEALPRRIGHDGDGTLRRRRRRPCAGSGLRRRRLPPHLPRLLSSARFRSSSLKKLISSPWPYSSFPLSFICIIIFKF